MRQYSIQIHGTDGMYILLFLLIWLYKSLKSWQSNRCMDKALASGRKEMVEGLGQNAAICVFQCLLALILSEFTAGQVTLAICHSLKICLSSFIV